MVRYAEKVMKGSSVVFLFSMYAMFIGYLVRIFLSRSLSVSDFGLFYAVNAFLGLFIFYKDLGLNSALVKYIPEFLVKKRYWKIKSSFVTVSIIQLIIVTVFALFIFGLSDYITLSFFNVPIASVILKILSLTVIFGVFLPIFQATFQGFQKMRLYALFEPVRISVIFISVLFLISFGVVGVAYAYLVAIFVSFAFFSIIFLKTFPLFLKIKFHYSKKLTKKLLCFGLPVLLSSVAVVIITYTDTILLTLFRSLEEVGLYQVALPTSQLLWVFIASLVMVLFPIISELWTRRKKRILEKGIGFLTFFSFFALIPIAIIMISFPDIIIRLLFGERYLAASSTLQILTFGALFYSLFLISKITLDGIGKPVINTKTILLMAGFNLIGNIILIPPFGILGAAIATSSSYLLGLLLSFYFLRKRITIQLYWLRLSKIFLGGLLSLLLIFYMKGLLILNPWAELFVCLSIGFSFYLFFIIISRAMIKSDLDVLREMNIRLPKRFLEMISSILRT